MSNLESWWEKRTSREKSLLLLLFLLLNITLFLHLEMFAAPLPKGAATSVHPQAGLADQSSVEPARPPSVPQPPLPPSQRDPFRPPAGAVMASNAPSVALSQPLSQTSAPQRSSPGASQAALSPALSLTGILAGENGARLVIIEFNGGSRHYRLHDKIGEYVVSAISDHGVTLSGPDGPLSLTLRR